MLDVNSFCNLSSRFKSSKASNRSTPLVGRPVAIPSPVNFFTTSGFPGDLTHSTALGTCERRVERKIEREMNKNRKKTTIIKQEAAAYIVISDLPIHLYVRSNPFFFFFFSFFNYRSKVILTHSQSMLDRLDCCIYFWARSPCVRFRFSEGVNIFLKEIAEVWKVSFLFTLRYSVGCRLTVSYKDSLLVFLNFH